ncbi:MAG: tetratricopeptide repeat protein, partial [Hyphomonadaceae bacterium]
ATLHAWGRDLSPGRIDRILATPLSSNPLFLKTVLEELRYSATELRLDERLEFYLQAPDVPGLFTRVLDRLEADCGADFTRDALSLIWASRSGLEEAELLRATQALPIVWSALRNNLNDALREQDGRITFSHNYLRNAVEMRYLTTPGLKRKAHLAIADLFSSCQPDERQAEEQLYQLRMAEDWTQLEHVLVDMERLPFNATRGPVELTGYWRVLQSHGRDPEALLLDAYEAYAQDPPSERMLVTGILLNSLLWDFGSRSARSEQHARRIAAGVAAAMGEEHNASIDTAAHLSLLLRARDDLAGARDAEQHILGIRRRVLGEQHDETLSAMNNLALTLETMGDLAGAQELQEKVLALRLETLGEAHVRTAQSMNNLALTVRARGDYRRARDLHARAHALFRRLKGADDPESLRAASNLIRSLSAAGQEAEARDLAEATFVTVSAVLGPEHPDTLTVMSNLAVCRQEAGDAQGALELSERCLELTAARSGPQHSDTLTCMSNLATVLDDLGDHRRALELLEKVVERNTVHLGADHPDTLVSKGNLAMICSHAGDHTRALHLLSEVGETRVRTLGEDHPSTLMAIANLASIYVVAKDFEFAR